MEKSNTQRRNYCDTFRGGTFHLEMTENRSATSPYLMDTSNLNLQDCRTPEEQEKFMRKLEFQPA